MKVYHLVRMRDYQKELDFWKDTIRKFLYKSKETEDSAERLFSIITDSLKTYSTRKNVGSHYDEIVYLANRYKHIACEQKSEYTEPES